MSLYKVTVRIIDSHSGTLWYVFQVKLSSKYCTACNVNLQQSLCSLLFFSHKILHIPQAKGEVAMVADVAGPAYKFELSSSVPFVGLFFAYSSDMIAHSHLSGCRTLGVVGR